MSEEPLSLNELQRAKAVLETKVMNLRQELHKLVRTRPDDWQEEFAKVQSKLIEVVTGIGALSKRIYALVEGEAGSAREEDYDDV